MDRKTLVKALEEIALLLELKGENPFRTRTYTNAARALGQIDGDVVALIRSGEIAHTKGFGDSLVQKLQELVKTGELGYLNELRQAFPETLMELFDIPGLGPKKIMAVYKELNVTGLAELEAACQDGRVAGLSGMGEKTAKNILDGIAQRRQNASLFHYQKVRAAADELLAELRRLPALEQIEVAGSLRRFKPVTKDMDLIGATTKPEEVMAAFCALPQAAKVVAHGKTKSQILLANGLSVDLRLVEPAAYPCALHHFTGSKDHNVAMRQRAIKRGMKLSEWGLFTMKDGAEQERLDIDSEAALFKALDLNPIPPELREADGEIEYAESHAIPTLVTVGDYRGSLHNHTHASDGANSLQEMVDHAQRLGHAYIGITDHSVSSFQANGLSADRLLEQVQAIRALQATRTDGFRIFAGVECDILAEGELDYADDVLAALDYFVISVHNGFGRDAEVMTRRVIAAIEHPGSRILAHPTGRLLLRRDPYPIHMDRVIDAAAANGVAIEFNCNPWRMDLDWSYWRKAREKGVLCSLNPDAHSTQNFDFVEQGIGFCRKGWLQADDIINCWDTDRLAKWLGRR